MARTIRVAVLAIGAPGEDVGTIAGAGAVSLVDGAAGGLLGGDNVLITESNAERGDGLGAAVEIGDLSGGGDPSEPDDLAVGIPGENLGATADAGAVVVLAGPATHQLLTQGGATTIGSVPGATGAGDAFEAALTPGNVDGNEFPDLAVGAPGETVAGKAAAGAADARDGGSSGLPADPDEPLYFQGSAAVPGTAETGDQFAAALSV